MKEIIEINDWNKKRGRRV